MDQIYLYIGVVVLIDTSDLIVDKEVGVFVRVVVMHDRVEEEVKEGVESEKNPVSPEKVLLWGPSKIEQV